ncbi:MAG: hypothetical protein AAF633_25165, partial [Chloroflexota bacterium]
MISTPDSNPISVYTVAQRTVQAVLICLLVIAFLTGFLTLVTAAEPTRPWFILLLPLLLVIIESYLTTSWLFQPEQRLLNKQHYRMAEIFLVIIYARLVGWWFTGNWPDPNDWYIYLTEPRLLIVDGFFWLTLLLSLIAWERTAAFAKQFKIL